MSVWVALSLVDLALDAVWSPRLRSALPAELAVHERGQIVGLTPAAVAAGVRLGMRPSLALAMVPGLVLAAREPQRERALQESLALAMQPFTPQIACPEPDGVLLDVSASLRLFNGIISLCHQIKKQLTGIAAHVRWGVAPTALGAMLLARGRRSTPRRLVQLARLRQHLDRCSWRALPIARAHEAWWLSLGCRTLGDLCRLPRAGLRQRVGHELILALDQLYGRAPKTLSWWCPPHEFAQVWEAEDPLQQTTDILQVAERLIQQLCAWLTAQAGVVDACQLTLHHDVRRAPQPQSVLTVRLSQPTAQADRWRRVLAERLQAYELCAPATAVSLYAGPSVPCRHDALTDDLFGGVTADAERLALLDLLVARLGSEAVSQPAALPDYRPERANRWLPVHDTQIQAVVHSAPAGQSSTSLAQAPLPARPAWLLRQPERLSSSAGQPLWQGLPLRLLAGPERVETGWWDGALCARDYFRAQAVSGESCWVFRERQGQNPSWWLHGWFD